MKAIVTGGNKGIGLEITRRLLDRGFTVHVLSRTGIDHPSERVVSWPVDLADWESTLAIIDKVGAPDVLVNNAGMLNAKAAVDYDGDAIRRMLDVNLVTSVRLSVHAAELMAANAGGRIVSIGSIAGTIGHPDIWYGITKAGLANAMRSLARSHGPRGVVANTVTPGPVETDMMKDIPQDRKERIKSVTINGRFCTPEEVADMACWLATDSPAYVNGEVFDMNNGVNFR